MKQVSGKLVILGTVVLALAAAGASWWYRYSATRRAADFYGPEARIIRDAPIVELLRFDPSTMEELDRLLDTPSSRHDISTAPGLTHLRAALLEDRSYNWPARLIAPDDIWQWILIFRNRPLGASRILLFSPDWQLVTEHGIQEDTEDFLLTRRVYIVSNRVVSCGPIAEGLKSMLEGLAKETSEPR